MMCTIGVCLEKSLGRNVSGLPRPIRAVENRKKEFRRCKTPTILSQSRLQQDADRCAAFRIRFPYLRSFESIVLGLAEKSVEMSRKVFD